jgi:TPR repeat protein
MKWTLKSLLFSLEGIIIVSLSVLLIISNQHRKSAIQMLDSIQVEDSVLKEKQQNLDALFHIRNYVLFTQDTAAYLEMYTTFYGANNLAYSIYMADHCNYPRACYNVYQEISSMIKNSANLEFKIEATRLAICYLKKGAALNDKLCAFVLAGMYIKGDYVQQDTVLGRKYLKQALGDQNTDVLFQNIKRSKNSWF